MTNTNLVDVDNLISGRNTTRPFELTVDQALLVEIARSLKSLRNNMIFLVIVVIIGIIISIISACSAALNSF